MAYPGFYLVSVGKPFGEKPTSPVVYDCLRASTGFCVNSQRMSVSEAPAETGRRFVTCKKVAAAFAPRGVISIFW